MSGCEKYRAQLMEYVDGRCDSAGEHVVACESCRQFVQELRQLRAMLAALPTHRAPDSLAESVRARIANGRRIPWISVSWPRLVPAAGVAALALAALVALPRINMHQSDVSQAQETIHAMKNLHSQVQLLYMLPADSPFAARPEAQPANREYDDLYDLDGM